jgi:ribosomal protein S18 acetylase RimI-like enzyme
LADRQKFDGSGRLRVPPDVADDDARLISVTMADYVLRSSQAADALQISSVFANSCKEAYAPLFPEFLIARYTPGHQLERWTEHLNTLPTTHHVIVATLASSQLIGFIEVGPSEKVGIGEISYLFVRPTSVRAGVGAALLQEGEHWLSSQGYKSGTLWVFCGNEAARKFYRKHGWQDLGIEQEEPTLLKEGASVMECQMRKTFTKEI